MLFNSYGFVVFLTATVGAFHATPVRHRTWVTLVASFVFYAMFSVPHLGLLICATVVAWLAAHRIRTMAEGRAKAALCWGIVAALFVPLMTLKYADTGLAIPVGISYYTFKLASYVIDTYWEKIENEPDVVGLMRYAAYFPQILSGPIQRADDFLSQEREPRAAEVPMIASGARLMLFGYFKKLVVADRAALLVDQTFGNPTAHPAALHWVGAYLFAIQLYADFSGLTDMANGAARMLGVEGPPNFDNPYYATNMQDFWRRWHISLTAWLTDYVFKPLHIALRNWGQFGLVVAIIVTMLGIGLWHGKNATFILAGSLYALYMTTSTLTLRARQKRFGKRLLGVRRFVGAVIVFHMMVFAFIPVRCANIHDAFFIMKEFVTGFATGPLMLLHPSTLWRTLEGWSNQQAALFVVGVAVMELVHIGQSRGFSLDARPRWQRWTAYYALGIAIVFFAMQRSASFIYFKF
jgi:D-alanyl-lipoteichoic acid acyltransferase DltB (MBOAT superfamily)